MKTLYDAVKALDERKSAVTSERVPSVDFDSNEARHMVLGFDLNLREMQTLAAHVGRYTQRRDDVGSSAEAAEAAWLDGVLSGLMLAELRAKESAS